MGCVSDDSNLTRLLHTLDLIQTRPGIRARDIGARLGVSTRAVRRSVATLRDAGFTIASTSGPAGGYRLDRGPRMPLVFTQDELAALAMSLVESSDAMADEAALTAASKILQGLPARAAAPARAVLEAATIVDNQLPRPTASVVLHLANAIEQAQQVSLDYRASTASKPRRRIFEPWGLVVRHRHWYLLGRDTARDATRTYRVDRVEHVDVLPEHFEHPRSIDVAAAFEDHLQNSWNFTTCVDLDVPAEAAREWIPFTMGTLISTGPESCRLEGKTNNCKSYVLDLLQTPCEFTVRGDCELLEAVSVIRARLHPGAGGNSTNVSGQYS